MKSLKMRYPSTGCGATQAHQRIRKELIIVTRHLRSALALIVAVFPALSSVCPEQPSSGVRVTRFARNPLSP
jgi:hypothetical protein